jgi:D-tyrosyl-tRNA(Tyr) deacylase
VRVVLQRVTQASVTVEDKVVGRIGPGLLVFLGVGKGDTAADAEYLASKVAHMRIFSDDDGKMNRSVLEILGEVLVVSQFTLYGDCRKGRRPGFDEAATPPIARKLYDYFVEKIRGFGIKTDTGVFQADMKVAILNDGPVTLICHSGNHV